MCNSERAHNNESYMNRNSERGNEFALKCYSLISKFITLFNFVKLYLLDFKKSYVEIPILTDMLIFTGICILEFIYSTTYKILEYESIIVNR